MEKLGIDTFWHYTISDSGHLTYLGNQSHIAEYFFHHKLYVNHPNFRSPKLMNEGSSMFRKELDNEGNQEEIKNNFSVDQIFLVSKKREETYHGYGFATTILPHDKRIDYNNYSLLLNKFISYFHHEAESLLRKANSNKVHIAPLIGDYFNHKIISEEQEKKKVNEFLELVTTLPKISKREKECLLLCMKGSSSREIGEKLQLSKRTVEHYLENNKNKWNCFSKGELIEKGSLYFYG